MMYGSKGNITIPGVYYSRQIRMTSSVDLKKMAEKRYSDIISDCKTLRLLKAPPTRSYSGL